MKKFIVFSISLLLGFSLFYWIYQQFEFGEIFFRFKFLSWRQITVLFLLGFYRLFAWVIRWQLVLKSMGFKRLSFKMLFSSRLAEMSLSYLTPGIRYGGEVIRIFVLKKKIGIPVNQGITSVIIDRLIDITAFGIFVFLGVFILFFQKNFFIAFLFFLIGFSTLLLIYLILQLLKSNKKIDRLIKFFHLNKLSQSNNLTKSFEIIKNGTLNFFKNYPKETFQGIILSCSTFLVGAIQISVFVKFLGEYCSFFNGILVKILNLFATLAPIPAGLGVFEAANILGFQISNLSPETGFSLTLMLRFLDLILVLAGALIILYYFTHRFFKFLTTNLKNKNN